MTCLACGAPYPVAFPDDAEQLRADDLRFRRALIAAQSTPRLMAKARDAMVKIGLDDEARAAAFTMFHLLREILFEETEAA